jgi:hypothetical protein
MIEFYKEILHYEDANYKELSESFRENEKKNYEKK